MIWIKNTSGKPDAMLTFAFLSFAVVTINVLLATFSSISFNGLDIKFVQMDAASMTAYLAATFTAYVTRRWTDAKHSTTAEEDSKE